MQQVDLDLNRKADSPVECLGNKFPNDEARREHFLKLLAQKLKDPEFRKIEGFPIGKDEDILALSDPPYYTACPNPWLAEFIKHYGKPYDQKKSYHREPFSGDLSVDERHPVYSFHPYHTKVPPDVIRTLLLHYTDQDQVVLDLYSGTGMTGVAARQCGRKFVGYDLAPVATFVSAVNNTTYNASRAVEYLEEMHSKVISSHGWMFKTMEKGRSVDVNYYVWSDVFTCPECAHAFPFFPYGVIHHGNKVETRKTFNCPECSVELNVRRIERVLVHEGKKKQLVWVNAGSGSKRVNRAPNDQDVALVTKINASRATVWFPTDAIDTAGYSAKLAQLGDKRITDISKFLSERNRLIFAEMWALALEVPADIRNLVRATLTSMFTVISERQGYFGGGGGMSGNLYMPIVRMEKNPFDCLRRKLARLKASEAAKPQLTQPSVLSTQSSCFLTALPDCSVDYIYTDPPFGANIIYNEMNLILEGWLKVKTNSTADAVIDETKSKDLESYGKMMRQAFCEAYRVLKPGKWITVEFHNTQASVWNLIQASLSEAGFVVANVAKLDKGSTTILADIRPGAVVQDLLISAYKPNGGLVERFTQRGETVEGAWDFVNSHLKNLPVAKVQGGELKFIAERDPRILYDRMVAFYIGHSTPVPLSSAEFQAGLVEKYLERDGMYFLPEQVNEYDKKRAQVENIGQLTIFVEDERSAINWLRNFLKDRPSTYRDIHPEFTEQLSASWKDWETRPELQALLDQNFLCYDGMGDVPSQIHSYLSTQFKELRNLPKDAVPLKNKAKNRWYVPDPKKNVDVETLRNKRLLEEFWSYLPEGYTPPALSANKGQTLPGLTVPRPKIPKGKKLKELRTEAVRVGFKHCYQQKDYTTILAVAEMIPDSVLNEDEQLQMIYDTAVTRSSGGE